MRAITNVVILTIAISVFILSLPVTNAADIYYMYIISSEVPPGGWFTVDALVSEPGYCDIILDDYYVLDSQYAFYDNYTGAYRLVDMVQIPSWVSEGYHDITLYCYGNSYSNSITVTVPEIYVYPTYVRVGDTINITVENINNMIQTFIITVDDIPIMVFEPSIHNYSFAKTIKVPPLTKGWHEIRLYVTIDIFQNLYFAIMTGLTIHDYMYVRGLFPERYVLVNTGRFYVEDGVILGNDIIANLTDELNTLDRKLKTIEANYNNIRYNINYINSTLINYAGVITDLSNQVGLLEDQLNLINRKILMIENKIDNSFEEINKSVVSLLENSYQNIQRNVSQKISIIENKIKDLKEENNELRARLEAQESEIERMQTKILNVGKSNYYLAIGLGVTGIFLGILGLAVNILLYRR